MSTVGLVLLALFAGLVGQAILLKRRPRVGRTGGGAGQQVRRSLVLRDTLPDELLARVDHVAEVLAVLGRPASEYVEELKREPHPIPFWEAWERVAAALEAFAATRPLTEVERREAALILRLRSMTDEADARKRVDPVALTAADVELLLGIYANGEAG